MEICPQTVQELAVPGRGSHWLKVLEVPSMGLDDGIWKHDQMVYQVKAMAGAEVEF